MTTTAPDLPFSGDALAKTGKRKSMHRVFIGERRPRQPIWDAVRTRSLQPALPIHEYAVRYRMPHTTEWRIGGWSDNLETVRQIRNMATEDADLGIEAEVVMRRKAGPVEAVTA